MMSNQNAERNVSEHVEIMMDKFMEDSLFRGA